MRENCLLCICGDFFNDTLGVEVGSKNFIQCFGIALKMKVHNIVVVLLTEFQQGICFTYLPCAFQ